MKEKVLNLLIRIYDLIMKFISVKGFIFTIASILMLQNKLEPWIWGFFAAGFSGLRALEKFIGAKIGKIDSNDGK